VFSGMVTCQTVQSPLVGPSEENSMLLPPVLVGFADGSILFLGHHPRPSIDSHSICAPLQASYCNYHSKSSLMINRYGSVNSSSVIGIEWLPRQRSKFVALHSNGKMYLYDLSLPSPARSEKSSLDQQQHCPLKKVRKSIFVSHPNSIPATNNPQSVWHLSSSSIVAMKFLSNSSELALIFRKVIVVVDIIKEKFISVFESSSKAFSGRFICACSSPCQNFLLVGSLEGITLLWHARTFIDFHETPRDSLAELSSIQFDIYQSKVEAHQRTYRFGSVTQNGLLILWSFSVSDHHIGQLMKSSGLMSSRDISFENIKLQQLCVLQLQLVPTSLLFLRRYLAIGCRGGHVRIWTRPEMNSKQHECNNRFMPPILPSMRSICLDTIVNHLDLIHFDVLNKYRNASIQTKEVILQIIRRNSPYLLENSNQMQYGIMTDLEKTDKKCHYCTASFGILWRKSINCQFCSHSVCNSCSKLLKHSTFAFQSNYENLNNIALCCHCYPLFLHLPD